MSMGVNNESFLLEGERLDSLDYKGMMLIQKKGEFCFGTDSVILSSFARVKKNESCIDMGAGSGVISVLLHARTLCRVTAVEVDPDQCGRLKRTCEYNGIGECVTVQNLDYIRDTELIGRGKFDAAVCNPPYFRTDCGELSRNYGATHEVNADIPSIAKAAAALLRYGGKFFLCFPAQRLSEAFTALTQAELEPKRLRLVRSKRVKPPYLALIEAKSGGKPGLTIEDELIIHGENGEYTEELRQIYHLDSENGRNE